MFLSSLLNNIKIIFKNKYLFYLYRKDMEIYIEHSCINFHNPECLATQIRVLSHAIEKGMSLPDCRKGFGKQKIIKIIELCDQYAKFQNINDPQAIELAYSVISSYIDFQSHEGVCVDFIPEEKKSLVSCNKLNAGVTENSGLIDPSLFKQVAEHRHSLRYFSNKAVSAFDIEKAVALAQSAPSACNRQPTRVYAVTSPDKIKKMMDLHGGIRTLSNPTVIFVITGDRTLYQGEYERNTVYVDGGIFTMNLLYALDSMGIASCPAIWGNIPGDDEAMKTIISISPSHTIINLIVAGYYPDGSYKFASSTRRNVESILNFR